MSESQEIDRPHVWWKELIKRRRLRWFDAALVGGPTHRDYLVQLGMPPARIALGYNAVDNDYFATAASHLAPSRERPFGLAAGSLFSRRLPVRSREEPGPLDQGVCGLPRSVRFAHGLGPGPLRRRAGAFPARAGDRSERLRACDSLSRLSSVRCAAALVRSRRRIRAAESFRALGARRQRSRRQRFAASGLISGGLRSHAGSGARRHDREPVRSARYRRNGG